MHYIKKSLVPSFLIISILSSGIFLPTKTAQAAGGGCTDLIAAIGEILYAKAFGNGETIPTAGGIVAGAASNFLAVPIFDALQIPIGAATVRIQALNSTQEALHTSDKIAEATKSTLKCLGGILAKRLLDMIVDQTTAWIQDGGKPKFVTNWEQFAKDAAQAGGGDVANALGLGFLCSNFDLNVRIILRNQTFSERATCTIDQIVGNIESFYNNFLDGGWIAYSEIWSHPANNYYGAVLIAAQEQSTRAASKLEAAINEGIAGGGYLSAKKVIADSSRRAVRTIGGKTNDAGNGEYVGDTERRVRLNKAANDVGSTLGTDEQADNELAAVSLGTDEEITTQGSTIGSVQNRALQSQFNILENVISTDSFAAYANAIADAALNRLIKKGVDGLKGLSTPNKPRGNVIASGDICPQLEGEARKACLSLNNFETLSPKNQKEKLQNDVNDEITDLRNIIAEATSSVPILGEESSTLSTLLSCQSVSIVTSTVLYTGSASTTRNRVTEVNNSIINLTKTIEQSNFIMSEIQDINKDLQTSVSSLALADILSRFNKYKDDRASLLGAVNKQGMVRQKNGFDLNLRRDKYELEQCQARFVSSP